MAGLLLIVIINIAYSLIFNRQPYENDFSGSERTERFYENNLR